MVPVFVFTIIMLTPLSISTAENDILKYSLYEVTAYNYRERAFLYSLYNNNHKYIFVNSLTNEAAIPIYVIVDKCCSESFEMELNANNIDFTYVNSDKQWGKSNKMTDNQEPLKTAINSSGINSFNNYYKIQLWIELKLKKYSMLTKLIIGKTYEDRDIIVLKISVGRRNCAILVVGGEEGRDWMSPVIIMNFISHMLENTDNINNLIDYCDFYFVPVFNPDGYDYSIKNDVFWTKNRKVFFPKKMCDDRIAIGVNIDRNWFFNKASNLQDAECKVVYAGEKPITEEEPQALFHFMNNIANNLMMYINVRSFERLITVPYGYTKMYSNNHLILMEILSATCDKIYKKHNATYFYGNTANILYNFSGNSADWVKKKLNIPVVLTVYLKYKESLFPNETHIQPLTNQFRTIIVDTLPSVNNIYGPLFNQVSYHIVTHRLLVATAILCTLFTLNNLF